MEERKCEKGEILYFLERQRWRVRVCQSQKLVKRQSDEQYDAGEKVDYSIRQERSDRKIYLIFLDQK